MSMGLLALAALVSMTIWLTAFRSGPAEVDAQVVMANACNFAGRWDFTVNIEDRVNRGDTIEHWSGKYRFSGYDRHTLMHNTTTGYMSEDILDADVGFFYRSAMNGSEWSEWNGNYWSDKELEHLESVQKQMGEIYRGEASPEDSEFCGYKHLLELKYVRNDIFENQPVQVFEAYRIQPDKAHLSKDDYYEHLTWWVDAGEKILKMKIVTYQGETDMRPERKSDATLTFMGYGEANDIIAPDIN